jgi:hypothetical protein
MKAGDDDWMFPHSRKTGLICHEQIKWARRFSPSHANSAFRNWQPNASQ